MERLEDKVAIVTGAAGGMGLGYARLFAQEGAQVVMTDINSKKLTLTAQNLLAEGLDVFPLVQDVADPEQWDHVMAQTLEHYGKLDILVNNAGVGAGNAHLRNIQDPEKLAVWKRVLDIQLYGPVYGMSRVLPYFVEQKHGVILNVTSLSAFTAMGGATAYTAAKSAIAGLTRAAAADNAKHGVRVNAILPGIILTDMMEEFKDPDCWWMQQELRRIKMNRYGTPEDTAKAGLFLCSDDADYITGVILPVDGGYLTGYPMRDKA